MVFTNTSNRTFYDPHVTIEQFSWGSDKQLGSTPEIFPRQFRRWLAVVVACTNFVEFLYHSHKCVCVCTGNNIYGLWVDSANSLHNNSLGVPANEPLTLEWIVMKLWRPGYQIISRRSVQSLINKCSKPITCSRKHHIVSVNDQRTLP